MVIVPSKSGSSVCRYGYVRRYGRHGVYFPKGRKTRLRIAYSRALSKEIFRKALSGASGKSLIESVAIQETADGDQTTNVDTRRKSRDCKTSAITNCSCA